MYFYTDNDDAASQYNRSGGGFNLQHIDATRIYLTHYSNMLMLDFLARHETDFRLKRQAERELDIARRKMKYWEHHQNFSQARALKGIEQLKRNWTPK